MLPGTKLIFYFLLRILSVCDFKDVPGQASFFFIGPEDSYREASWARCQAVALRSFHSNSNSSKLLKHENNGLVVECNRLNPSL